MVDGNRQLILINAKKDLVEYVLNRTDFQIAVLIASKQILDAYGNHPRVKQCFLNEDIYKMRGTENLRYDIIRKYPHTQVKAENSFDRQILDYQIKKSEYYFALNFWSGIFMRNNIGAVVIDEFNHGSIVDGIPHDMAVSLGIDTYMIEPVMLKKNALKKANTDEYLPLNSPETIDLEASKQYKMPYDEILDAVIKSYAHTDNAIVKLLLKNIYKAGGALAFEFLYCLSKGSFIRKNSSSGVEFDYRNEWSSYRILKKNKKYLDSISKKEIPDTNFIFYAMHFEPEASLNARVELESQLIIISMLADCLPPGWELAVKEHPHQFKLNNTLMYYYINTAPYFKSKNFYHFLNNMDRVRILDSKLNSMDIIRKSKAVATINGTIAAEAQDYNKPVMIFSEKSTILRYCRDILPIDGYESCKAAINRIAGGFVPDYGDVQKVAQTYLTNENELGRRTILDRINQDISLKN